MTADPRILALVTEGMTNALENGYTFDGWTDEEIAHDIWTYDAELEDEDKEKIIEAVTEWRKSRI